MWQTDGDDYLQVEVTSIRLLSLLFGYRVSVRTVLHATRQR